MCLFEAESTGAKLSATSVKHFLPVDFNFRLQTWIKYAFFDYDWQPRMAKPSETTSGKRIPMGLKPWLALAP
jgi:hypothetical protein